MNKIFAKKNFGYGFQIYYEGVNIVNSCELTAFITAIANAISNKLSVEETTLLAAVIVQLGDTLATIATQKSICETKEDECKN